MLCMHEKYDIIYSTQDGWLTCPVCRRNKRLLQVTPQTSAENLIVFCRICKTEHLIDIRKGECFKSQGQ